MSGSAALHRDTHPAFRFITHSGETGSVLDVVVGDVGGDQVVFLTKEQADQLKGGDLSAVSPALNDFSGALDPQLIKDWGGKDGKIEVLYQNGKRLVLVGLGAAKAKVQSFGGPRTEHPILKSLRNAVYLAIAQLQKLKVANATFHFTADALPADLKDTLTNAVHVAVTSNNTYDRYKKPASRMHRVTKVGINVAGSVQGTNVEDVIREARLIAEGTVLAQELCGERADVATPEYFLAAAQALAATHSNITVNVVDGVQALKSLGYNLIAAVGQGSIPERSPKLIAVEYRGEDSGDDRWSALVGKGIVFDCGGLNIKMTGHIEEMHYDKGGASAVLGAMKTLAQLRPPGKVVGILCMAENAVDANSYKPHAYVDTPFGSVEVSNTDAEGRLALADGMVYAHRNYSLSSIVDIATLTGAIISALGEHTAGIFSNNCSLAESVIVSGQGVGERYWRMPIYQESHEALKGTFSDYKSTAGPKGGSSNAAAFIEMFASKAPPKNPPTPNAPYKKAEEAEKKEEGEKTEEEVEHTPWAHLDIAGPAMPGKRYGHLPNGATGFGAATLARYILNKSKVQQ